MSPRIALAGFAALLLSTSASAVTHNLHCTIDVQEGDWHYAGEHDFHLFETFAYEPPGVLQAGERLRVAEDSFLYRDSRGVLFVKPKVYFADLYNSGSQLVGRKQLLSIDIVLQNRGGASHFHVSTYLPATSSSEWRVVSPAGVQAILPRFDGFDPQLAQQNGANIGGTATANDIQCRYVGTDLY